MLASPSLLPSPPISSACTLQASRLCLPKSSYFRVRSNSPGSLLLCEPQSASTLWRSVRPSRHVPCSQASPAIATAEAPMEALAPEQQAVWKASVQAVAEAVEGMSSEEAEDKLQQAFGWGPRANKFWRGRKVKEAPQEGQVASALSFLSSIGLAGPDLAKVVKTFPEALACSVEGQLKESVKKLEGEWKLKNQVLVKAIARQPQVLGYDYDCQGSCEGECNRCWARF